jgi:hypothetical protein
MMAKKYRIVKCSNDPSGKSYWYEIEERIFWFFWSTLHIEATAIYYSTPMKFWTIIQAEGHIKVLTDRIAREKVTRVVLK